MKLEVAIEIGNYLVKAETIIYTPTHYKALNLLIEAGNREMECRKGIPPESWDLLPGETTD